MTKTCVRIEFALRCSAEQYEALAERAAPRVNEVPGLSAKLWWLNRQMGRAGGVYTFESAAAAQAYLDGPLVSALSDPSSFCEDVETSCSELLETPTAKTNPVHAVPMAEKADVKPSPQATPQARVEGFAHKVLGDLSGAMTAAMVKLGHDLGLYSALSSAGPLTSQGLAERVGILERYAREWLHQQRAAGYLHFDPGTASFELSEEAQVVMAAEQGPLFLAPAFGVAATLWADLGKLEAAFRSGRGIGWGEHDSHLYCACSRFFENAYRAHLVQSWLPALEGTVQRLERGARVADVGCGHAASTLILAHRFRASRFFGFDTHQESIEIARQRAERESVSDRVQLQRASATDYSGGPYDLICFMDAFHDMGNAVEAARHARRSLAPGGCVVLVEPHAAAKPEDNVGPLAAMNYAASTALCTPSALCHPGGVALGAQAGPDALCQALAQGGLAHCRVVAETPFHLVIEARP